MAKHVTLVASFTAVCALVGPALPAAHASAPTFFTARHTAANQAVSGRLQVNGVLRVRKNASVFGRTYSHGGLQVWKGLVVRSGGLSADKLTVAGPITGTSLSLSGSLTTVGSISGASLTAGAIADTGGLSAGSITSSGSATVAGLNVSGSATLKSASITDLTATNINLNNASLHTLTVSNTLNAGSTGGTTTPLLLSANGHTVALGVTASGVLVVGGTLLAAGDVVTNNVGIDKNLSVNGISAFNSNATLANGSSLILSTASNRASHLIANGDHDVAGTVTMAIPASGFVAGRESTSTYNFATAYGSPPIVVITPTSDPEPNSVSGAAPKIWTTSTSTNFTIHYVPAPAASGTAPPTVTFHYVVVGQ